MGAAAVPIVIGASVLAAGVSAYSTIQQTNEAAAAARYQEQVAENNAAIARAKAADALERGRVEEREQQIKTSQILGQFRASAASRGVDVDAGSALDIQGDIEELGRLEAAQVISNSQREALGFENQAVEFQGEQDLLKFRRNSLKAQLPVSVGASLLSGASTVAGKWHQYKG